MVFIVTRKIGDSIIIAKEIWITFLGYQGLSVRIGIDAPSTTVIDCSGQQAFGSRMIHSVTRDNIDGVQE